MLEELEDMYKDEVIRLGEKINILEEELNTQKEIVENLERKFEYLLKRLNFHSHPTEKNNHGT